MDKFLGDRAELSKTAHSPLDEHSSIVLMLDLQPFLFLMYPYATEALISRNIADDISVEDLVRKLEASSKR